MSTISTIPSSTTPAPLDESIIGTLTDPTPASGALNALSATVPTASIDQNASYATILKVNPSAAGPSSPIRSTRASSPRSRPTPDPGFVSHRTVITCAFLYFFYCGDDSSFPSRSAGWRAEFFTTAKRRSVLPM
jgi:hypothetical protein